MQPRNLRLSVHENWDKYVSFQCQTFSEWYYGFKIFIYKEGVLFYGSLGMYLCKILKVKIELAFKMEDGNLNQKSRIQDEIEIIKRI